MQISVNDTSTSFIHSDLMKSPVPVPSKKISESLRALFRCSRERSIVECLIIVQWNNNARAGRFRGLSQIVFPTVSVIMTLSHEHPP